MHQVYLKIFNLELTTAPLQDPRYILDIGTGIGEWAIGMAERYPDCEVFGTDIAPVQPTDQVPFNVEFQIEDARDEWIRPADTVDLVHLRNMSGAFSDWAFIYQQAYNCIRPGGYIEVMDFDDHRGQENFLSWFPEGSPVHVLSAAVQEASILDGRRKGVEHLNRQMLMDAGFVDLEEAQYDMPLGRRENNRIGGDWLFAVITGIEATCLRLVTRHLGWDATYTRELCDSVAVELKKMADDPRRARGFAVKLRVIVGRKPAVPGQWTAQSLAENGEIVDDSSESQSTIGSESTAEISI
jgi:SAM-dependent methyltransferase